VGCYGGSMRVVNIDGGSVMETGNVNEKTVRKEWSA
jgi:hypothetical protein